MAAVILKMPLGPRRIKEHIETLLKGFDFDPADTDYQVGYQSALEDLADWIEEQEKDSG